MSIRTLSVVFVVVAGCSKTAQVRPDATSVALAPKPPPVVVATEEIQPASDATEGLDHRRNDSLAPPVVMFGFDSTELSAQERERLAAWASAFRASGVPTQAPVITIEGHCDERGTEEYNLVLGEKRASAVRTYLGRMGFDTAKIRTVSYGESRPARLERTEEAFAANRRAEVVVPGASAPNRVTHKPVAVR